MPSARTPSRWPYRAGKPARRKRVVKARDDAERGVHKRETPASRWTVTRRQARAGLAAAMLVAVASVAWWAHQSPYLTVHDVEVHGTSRLTEQQVRAAAGLDGDSAFMLDIDTAEKRVAALPYVRSADVERHGWTAVTITVDERTVWGSWRIDGVDVPIDDQGYVLDGPPPVDAPVIVEVQPQRVVNAGDQLDAGAVELAARLTAESETAFGRRVLALLYRRNAGITAVLSSPDIDGKAIWVTFGDSRDYDYKVATLYVLLEQAKERDLALNAVDLRFGDRLSFN